MQNPFDSISLVTSFPLVNIENLNTNLKDLMFSTKEGLNKCSYSILLGIMNEKEKRHENTLKNL